jgi:hypothetical protein
MAPDPSDRLPAPPASAHTTLRAEHVYGAELDSYMCPVCAAHAGLEYRPGDPQAPTIPNPACTSMHGCRCAWI